MRARASATEFILPARGSTAGECSSLRSVRSLAQLALSRPHCRLHPKFLHRLGEMQQVERAVPALIGEPAQSLRLVARPGVEVSL
jgi:hypothetical protein